MAWRKHQIVDNLFSILKLFCCCVKQDNDEERSPSTERQPEEICKVDGGKPVKFQDFNLLRLIGRGSFAKVLMVEERSTQQIFAMKIIKKQSTCTDVSKKKMSELVETERRVFGMATDCPFLVGMHACFQTPSRLFFIIEFASGGDMISHTGKYERLPEEHVRFYSAEISIALNFLHGRGVAYRDLKLDNILLDRDGHIKLTDYGLCKAGLQPGFLMSTFCGTHRYMSPELLRREKYGYSVDWWALGVAMFEMMTGQSPFDADFNSPNYEECVTEAILYEALKTPTFMSGDAVSILNELLKKNPDERLGFAGVQSHIFYCTINWDRLVQRQVAPPFIPQVKSAHDVENFDPEFTNESADLTPDNSIIVDAGTDEFNFQGFEYDWENSVNAPGNSEATRRGHYEPEVEVGRQHSEVLPRSSWFSFVDIKRANSVPDTFVQ